MKERQLTDRKETYSEIIEGHCSCGERINKVLNSNIRAWKNGERYHYPDEKTAWCIFRCKNCHHVISETFKPFKS